MDLMTPHQQKEKGGGGEEEKEKKERYWTHKSIHTMTSQFWVESRSQCQIQRIKIFEDNLGKYPYDHWPGKDTLK